MIERYDSYNHRESTCGYTNPHILKDAGVKMVQIIRDKFPGKVWILVGRGGSGSSLATACHLEINDEQLSRLVVTHDDGAMGRRLKWEVEDLCGKPHAIIFVDDFFCMGNTLEGCQKEAASSHRTIDLAIVIAKSSNCPQVFRGIPVVSLK